MASKVVCFVVVLCIMQCVFAKDLVRRDILSDTVAPIVKTAQAVADKLSAAATEFINEFNATEQQVSKETDSIKTTVQQISVGIQDKIKAIFAEATQAGINVESCATGILAAVANVETQSGQYFIACALDATNSPKALLQDIINLKLQALQLVASIPARVSSCLNNILGSLICAADIASSVTAQGLQITSSLTGTEGKFLLELKDVPGKLLTCSAGAAANATAEFGDIIASVQACVQKLRIAG